MSGSGAISNSAQLVSQQASVAAAGQTSSSVAGSGLFDASGDQTSSWASLWSTLSVGGEPADEPDSGTGSGASNGVSNGGGSEAGIGGGGDAATAGQSATPESVSSSSASRVTQAEGVRSVAGGLNTANLLFAGLSGGEQVVADASGQQGTDMASLQSRLAGSGSTAAGASSRSTALASLSATATATAAGNWQAGDGILRQSAAAGVLAARASGSSGGLSAGWVAGGANAGVAGRVGAAVADATPEDMATEMATSAGASAKTGSAGPDVSAADLSAAGALTTGVPAIGSAAANRIQTIAALDGADWKAAGQGSTQRSDPDSASHANTALGRGQRSGWGTSHHGSSSSRSSEKSVSPASVSAMTTLDPSTLALAQLPVTTVTQIPAAPVQSGVQSSVQSIIQSSAQSSALSRAQSGSGVGSGSVFGSLAAAGTAPLKAQAAKGVLAEADALPSAAGTGSRSMSAEMSAEISASGSGAGQQEPSAVLNASQVSSLSTAPGASLESAKGVLEGGAGSSQSVHVAHRGKIQTAPSAASSTASLAASSTASSGVTSALSTTSDSVPAGRTTVTGDLKASADSGRDIAASAQGLAPQSAPATAGQQIGNGGTDLTGQGANLSGQPDGAVVAGTVATPTQELEAVGAAARNGSMGSVSSLRNGGHAASSISSSAVAKGSVSGVQAEGGAAATIANVGQISDREWHGQGAPGGSAENGTSGDGKSSSGSSSSGASQTFAALDQATGDSRAVWVHAGSRQAEAGYQDPTLGWVGVRAEVSGGSVHASLVPSSATAAAALSQHMSGLSQHMADNNMTLGSLSMSSPGGQASSGAGAGQQQGASSQSGEADTGAFRTATASSRGAGQMAGESTLAALSSTYAATNQNGHSQWVA